MGRGLDKSQACQTITESILQMWMRSNNLLLVGLSVCLEISQIGLDNRRQLIVWIFESR